MRTLWEWSGYAAAILVAAAVLPISFVGLYGVYTELTAPIDRYRSITAEITASRVQRSQVSNVGRNSSTVSWSVNIDYRYVVDGVAHGSYGHYVGAPANEAEATALGRGRFAVGRPIRVFYDPQRPAESRLDAGRNYLRIGGLTALSAIFLAPMFFVARELVHRMRRP